MKNRHKYSEWDVDRVRKLDIRDFIPGCSRQKATQDIDCPNCGKKKFSVVHKGDKNFATCHYCQFTLHDPIAACAYFANIDIKNNWVMALEETARQGGVLLTMEDDGQEKRPSKVTNTVSTRFCTRQLDGSGLSYEDVMATTLDGSQETLRSPFRPGSIDNKFNPQETGDEMLIFYYDLYGRPMTYLGKGSARPKQYVRVRWSNPALHKDSDGKDTKYQTPAGAPCRVYIPEKIRRLFKNRTHIDTLFLQEGEKKAEKACKHGMLSIGIQGINNFGSQENGLLQDIQDIAKECTISNIVLVMDSDWNDLHRNIIIGDSADKRPNSFSHAVIKYRQYMRTFSNIQLSVDIWWAHVNANANGDKGVDDLLCGSLKGRESELMEDVQRTMNSHDGKGTWLNVHKITEVSDTKIRSFWSLNDAQAFYDLHKDRLAEVGTFKIGPIRYKVEDDKIVALSRYSSDVDIYTVRKDAKKGDIIEFNDVETYRFLQASGFHRLRNSEEAGAGFRYIRIDDGIIDYINQFEIRDFVRDYIFANCKAEPVLQYFTKHLPTLMAEKQLENLKIISEDFNHFKAGKQSTYYNNGQIEITSRSITTNLPFGQVWRSRIIPRDFRRIEVIKSITKADDVYYIEISDEGRKCEFLSYLINTSNNFYTHDMTRETTEKENIEWNQHLVNKITAIGFLLSDWKYPSDRQAVVVQDHRISEVGQAWGGAGKSVLGTAISKVSPQFFINGQDFNSNDQFILSGVTKATRNIFIDDVRPNFDFKSIFNWITGPMPINPKGRDRYTIPVEDSPKILLTTNHAIKGASEGSVKRRIAYVEFSSWYNQDHALIDDFHHMFFDDWDEYQWTLFDNLMAECVMYYFRSFDETWHREGRGVVPPPMKNIELRTLRQAMGETFLAWADEYYDPSGNNLNERRNRKDLWASFLEYAGTPNGHGVTRTNIRRKIESYCKFKGYDFNTQKQNDDGAYYATWKPQHPDETFIGGDDKGGGQEYLTVFSPEKEQELKPF